MMGLLSLVTERLGPSGFGLAPIVEEVTEGIDASNLMAIVTGTTTFFLLFCYKSIKLL
jgi:retinol dehydrogenase-12